MTIRRRLVAVAALCVALPLLCATIVGLIVSGPVLSDRLYHRLDLALSGAQVSLVVRQSALLRDVTAAAETTPPAAAVASLTESGRADVAVVEGPNGEVVASTNRPGIPAAVAGPGQLTAQAPYQGQNGTLAAAVVLTPALLATLAPGHGITLSLDPGRPGHSRRGGTYLSRAVLPGGAGTLAAAQSGDPVGTTQRRGLLIAVLIVVALTALVLVLSDVVVSVAARPLERLVEWAESSGHLDVPAETGVDPQVDTLTQAIKQVTRDLRDRDAQLQDSREAFRLALERLGDVLAATHDLEGIVEAVVETALLAVPADVAVYYQVTAMPAKLQAVHARGVAFDRLALDGTGVAGYAALTQEVATLPGPALLDPAEPPAAAAVALPVRSLDRLVGVLGAYGTTIGRPFSDEEIRSLHTLVRQAEVAIANIELHAQAQRDALTDGVTGLWNRRQFDLRCRDAQMSSARFGEPFAVALFDIDDFKRVNDSYDHFTGDAALIHLAQILRRCSREVDVVARWGGEEFVILVQRGGVDEAAVVAERVRADLRASPLVYEGKVISFTVSAGVASHPHSGVTAAAVVAAADAALLRAKGSGKDRVVLAPPAAAERVERLPGG